MAVETHARRVFLVLTARCNLTCGYCFQNDKKRLRMDWETARASIDMALASSEECVELVFFGGEPLLEFPLIRRAVGYAETHRPGAKKLKFGMITNGTLLTPRVAAFIAGRRFDTQLSFDGVGPAQDVRGRGTFDRLDRLLDDLSKRHPVFFRNLKIGLTLTPPTLQHLADSIEYFLEKGIREVSISPVFTHAPGWRLEMIGDLEEQFARIVDSSLRHYRQTGRIPLKLLRGPYRRRRGAPMGRTMCGVMRGASPAVDVDGQVHGCVTFADSFQKFSSTFLKSRIDSLRLGDVRDPGLADRYEEFPEAVRKTAIFHAKQDKYSAYGRCRECRYLESCGICPMSIGHIPGNEDPNRVPDFSCAYNLVSLRSREIFARRLPRVIPSSRRKRLARCMSLLKQLAAHPGTPL